MGDDDATVVLTEPAAIKALAHPARVRLIDALYDGRELTATEGAQLTGLTPSAMSYHLRALQRFGLVEPAAAGADGRERRWKAVGRSLRIATGHTSAGLSAETASLQVLLAERVREVVDWTAGSDREPPDWQRIDNVTTSRIWLTADEAVALQHEFLAAIDRYRDRRDPVVRPEAARSVRLTIITSPVDR